MDWQFIIGTAIVVAVNLITVVGAYYGLKADNAKLGSDLAIAMLTERSDRISGQTAMKADLTTLLSAVETSVKELAHRVTTLESGQDEWTKSLRDRTHHLAEQMQVLVLKVDRLERPGGHAEDGARG